MILIIFMAEKILFLGLKSSGLSFTRKQGKSLVICFGMMLHLLAAQNRDTLVVSVVHGHKVKKAFRKVYKVRSGKASLKSVGGLKGGHVEVHLDGQVYGFTDRPQAKIPHLFPHNKKKSNGLFLKISEADWQKKNQSSQVTFIKIPLRADLRDSLQQQYEANIQASPYDFALFGMRCASSAYDMLARFGILEKRNRRQTVLGIFHPRAFRKKVLPWGKEKGYAVEVQEGIGEKKWDR